MNFSEADWQNLEDANDAAALQETANKVFIAGFHGYAGVKFAGVLADLVSSGVVTYRDDDGRFVVYDGVDESNNGVVDPEEIENLTNGYFWESATVIGGKGNDYLYGTENDDDVLIGGSGLDVLDGREGADLMKGGEGNDIYVIDDEGDSIVEKNGEGVDWARSSVSFVLSENVEDLDLTGDDDIAGMGNDVDNIINGNSGDNLIQGLGGKDKLSGFGGDDIIYGGEGVDKLYGGDDEDRLYGDSENDELYGGGEADILEGGAGNDLLDGGEGADELKGGEGFDTYFADSEDTIRDSDKRGEVKLDERLLTGGSREEDDPVNIYHGANGDTYRLSGDTLTVNNGLTIDDFSDGDLGIDLVTKPVPVPVPVPPVPVPTPVPTPASPLILDLDGDGIETVGHNAGIHFDHGGDSFRELSGFVAPDDGLLALDRNGNGKIDNGRELFGNSTLLSDGSTAANGFEALRDLDSNDDGVIDSNDDLFSELRVFQDLDQDGVTDEGELQSLADAGIDQLFLDYTQQNFVDASGNAHKQVGQYTNSQGQTYAMTDVWFDTNITDTVGEEIEISPEILLLPNARGFGRVHSLHQAMARDEFGELQGLVEQFATAENRAARLDLVEEIIFKWTGQEGDYRQHFHSPVDTRKVGAIGEFLGVSIDNPRGSGQIYAMRYKAKFAGLVDTVFFQMSASGHLKQFFEDIQWTEQASGVWQGDFSAVVPELFEVARANPESGFDLVLDFVQAIRGVNVNNLVNRELLRGELQAFIEDPANEIDLDSHSDALMHALSNGITDGRDRINGTGKDDILYALGGFDTIYGRQGDDTLVGGRGDDELNGGQGSDTYRFGAGDGRDRVVNNDSELGSVDVVHLYSGLTSEDISVFRQGDDLVIEIDGTEDAIRVSSHFEGEGAKHNHIDAVVFDDGSRIEVGPDQFDQINVRSQNITEEGNELHGTSENDVLDGLGGDDQIYGKKGDDQLSGSDGADTIHGDEGHDSLRGGSGEDRLYGGAGNDEILGGAGHDRLHGDAGDDTLEGGAGDDYLSGGEGNDTYRFNLGDGLDYIRNDGAEADTDIIEFGPGILPEDVLVRGTGRDLLLQILSSGEEIRIADFFASEAQKVEAVVFSDPGSSVSQWTKAELEVLAFTAADSDDELHGDDRNNVLNGLGGDDEVVGHAGDDTLYGDIGNDSLEGGDGDDVLSGGDGADELSGGRGNDTLGGGAGNDYLSGGAGADVYLVKADGSQDVIQDYDYNNSDIDKLRLEAGINPEHLSYRRTAKDLVIDIAKNGLVTSVTIENGFVNPSNLIDSLEFDDGTSIQLVDVLADAAEYVGDSTSERIYGYAGDDKIWGEAGADRLYGQDGDDQLAGGEGNDTLLGEGGDDLLFGDEGNDSLRGGHGNDELQGGLGEDDLSGGAGEDKLFGQEGDDYIQGNDGNDSLVGGLGDDILIGGSGDDDYYYTAGDGQDVIRDHEGQITIYVSEIDLEELVFRRNGRDLDIHFEGAPEDKITIDNYYPGIGQFAARSIGFFNQSTGFSQVLSADDINSRSMEATENDDVIRGDSEANTIDGLAGNDILHGSEGNDNLNGATGNDSLFGDTGDDTLTGGDGEDYLEGGEGHDELFGGLGDDQLRGGNAADALHGGEGSDVLYGGDGSDLLAGGTGDDDLRGDQGDDVYRFSKGDGADTIYDAGGQDRIEFTDVASSEVVVRREGDHLLITVPSTGDSVFIERQFDGTGIEVQSNSLEAVDFSDGVSWTFSDLMDEAVAGTAGDDLIQGFSQDEIINGGDGADEIYGHEGADTILGGAGNDDLEGGDGQDELLGGLGEDELRGGAGDDTLQGGAGTDNLFGGAGSDLLAGDQGDDRLMGEQGDDVYRFSKGDGADTLYDAGGQDRIEFTDVTSSEVVVRREDDHLRITVPSTGDSIFIERQFDGTGTAVQSTSLETVDFSDGVSWTFNDLMDQAVAGTTGDDLIQGFSQDEIINGGDGADEIYGHEGADTIVGGAGNDELDGGDGEDSLAGGTGDDVLRGGAAADTLQGGDGADTLYAGEGNDTLLGDAGNDELHGGAGNDQLSGGADADELFGDSGADTLSGGAGDDVLHGGSGNDTLSGDAGNDILRGDGGSDTLSGGEGNDELYGTGELFGGNGDDVLEGRGTLDGGAGNDLLQGQGSDTLLGGAGDDVLIANTDAWQQTANTLEGGTGADQLFGSYGNDVYRFNLGDGQDVVTETPQDGAFSNITPSEDTLEFGAGISAEDLSYVRSGKDLQISHANGTDGILIKNWFQEPNNHFKVNSFVFADGTVWSDLDVEEASITVGTESADTLFGYRDLNEEILAGAGDDRVWGRAGNDVLRGEAGDDYLDGEEGDDLLVGGAGEDNLVGRAGNDTLEGGIGNDSLQGGVGQDVLRGGAGEDSLFGGDGNDDLSGGADDDYFDAGAGDDVLNGDAGNDQLNGGLGDDVLSGGTGNDRYIFAAGTGNDTINNADGGNDGIMFTGGASEDRISFTRDGDDLVLLIDEGAEGSVRVVNHFLGGDYAIDWVQPEGGYMLSTAQINQRVAAGEVSGDFDSVVTGTDSGEQLVGGNDNNLMQGLGGNDTLFAMGGDDQLEGGAGSDQLYGGNGSGSGSGNDVLIGGDGNDTLVGEDGDDMLAGGAGNDRYYYKAGQGVDVIDNQGGGSDGIFFLGGLSRDRLSYHQDGNDLVILVDGDMAQQVRVTDHFLGGEYAINYVQPTDGGYSIMAGDIAGMLTNLPGQESDPVDDPADDPVEEPVGDNGSDDGSDGGATADPEEPADSEPAPQFGGDDVLNGSSGNDILVGGAGNDTLSGGAGNDQLIGGNGDDSYVFTGGQDSFKESGGTDTLTFGAGITFGQVASGLMKSGDDLVLRVNGGPDQVTLTDFFVGGDSVIETLAFETGGQISAGQIYGAFGMSQPTPSSSFSQTLAGTAGDDGSLAGGTGADLVQGFNGNDTLSGAAGADRLEGGNGNDSLRGGQGNDTLVGGRGDDSYLFSAGDGQDTINNAGGGNDTLLFEDISFNQIASGLMKSGNDLKLRVGGTSDSVTIQGFFSGGDQSIDQIAFGSGGQISAGQIFGAFGMANPDPQGSPTYVDLPDERGFGNLVSGSASAETIQGSSDSDFIDGGAGNDILIGGIGNDYLLGGEGADTYRFASGHGQDAINNLANGDANDSLHFESGIDESQLWFERDGNDLVTSVLGSDDQVRVQGWYSDDAQKLSSVHTDDAMITANQLEQLVAAMASFGQPAGGEITLTPQEESQAQAAIASSWQPA
jgi:Ca2+-binding RTX toxin-like protein